MAVMDRAAVDGPATADLRAQIRAALATEGLTQADLAEALGMSQKHVSQALTGRAGLSLALAERMLAVMGRRVHVVVRERAYGWDSVSPGTL